MSTLSAPPGGRERIIECALRMLRDQRPDQLSIREVGRCAHVSSGAPYHHFVDRSGLLLACAEIGWAELHDVLKGVDRELPLDRQLSLVAERYLSFAKANPGLYRLMMSAGVPDEGLPESVRILRAQALSQVTDRLPEPEDAAAEKSSGLVLWSLMHGYVMLRLDGALTGGSNPAEQEQRLIEVLVQLALLR